MKEINVSKGLAMVCILYLHLALANSESVFQIVLPHQSFSLNNIGGFILPMFFILAGFTYSAAKKSLGYEIRQKVLKLLVYFAKYFVITGILFSVIELIKGKYSAVECLRAMMCEFLTRSTCETIGPSFYFKTDFHNLYVAVWYVWTYLFAMLLFLLVARIPARSAGSRLCILSGTGLLGIAVYVFLPELPFELNIVPGMTFLMYAAWMIRQYRLYSAFTALKARYKVPVLAAGILLGVFCLSFCSVGWMSHGTFVNPYGIDGMESLPSFAVWLFAMAGSLLLSFVLIYLCRFIGRIPAAGSFLAFIGVNSLDTMLLHTFFAMSFCEITGLVCGRYLGTGDTVTAWIRIQCVLVFVLTLVLCYFWPKVKIGFFKKVKCRRM